MGRRVKRILDYTSFPSHVLKGRLDGATGVRNRYRYIDILVEGKFTVFIN